MNNHEKRQSHDKIKTKTSYKRTPKIKPEKRKERNIKIRHKIQQENWKHK